MVDRQSLIPDDLPYGERKNLVAARRQAQLPVAASGGPARQISPPSSSTASRPPVPQSSAGLASFDPLRETTPDQYPGLSTPPVLDDVQRPPATVKEALIRTSTTARSAFMREIGRRLAERQ